MNIFRKKSFVKSYTQLPRKIQDKADDTLLLFESDPTNDVLHNH